MGSKTGTARVDISIGFERHPSDALFDLGFTPVVFVNDRDKRILRVTPMDFTRGKTNLTALVSDNRYLADMIA